MNQLKILSYIQNAPFLYILQFTQLLYSIIFIRKKNYKHMKQTIHNISRFRIERGMHEPHYSMHSAHSHTYYELFYLVNGNCTISLDNKLYTLSAGNIIFIPANAIHRTSYIGDNPSERIYIEFSSDYISTIEDILGKNWTGKNLWGHILYIEPTHKSYINSLFDKIISEYNIIDHYSDCCIRQLFQYLIIMLIRVDRTNIDEKNYITHSHKKIEADMISASRYIAENFKNNISLNDVAEFLNLNPAYFSSKFKAFHGIGFSEYLRNTRINHAEWYLIETDLSMSDVADECGFCSSNYFGDTFKIVNGISPSEFRRKYKPNKA